VPGVSDVEDVAAGSAYTCALRSGGAVMCWGKNQHRQISSEAPPNHRDCVTSPLAVKEAPPDVIALSGGASHTCAVGKSGKAHCWGIGISGELGSGQPFAFGAPAPPAVGVDGLVAIVAGGSEYLGHSCAVRRDGRVRCWGGNTFAQLGNGKVEERSKKKDSDAGTPTPSADSVVGLPPVERIAVGLLSTCAVDREGAVWCWGRAGALVPVADDKSYVPKATKVEGVQNARQVAVGAEGYACILTATGTVECWGYNSSGQLARPAEKKNKLARAAVPNLTDVIEIAAGWSHTCALKKDGSLYCWGDNASGQLGTGDTKRRDEPTLVPL
jgi:alpha-tubulin suppressor-like RCC1 family protein